jgi:hypothetical protein
MAASAPALARYLHSVHHVRVPPAGAVMATFTAYAVKTFDILVVALIFTALT